MPRTPSAPTTPINRTPNIDRIAKEGVRFDNCFCTNSICTPSRGVIMTGQYSHITGIRTLGDELDPARQNVAKLLQGAGYQTAFVGKWHLKKDPSGFDYWIMLPGQGLYHNPVMIEMGQKKQLQGYATDLITDYSLDYLKRRKKDQPFFHFLGAAGAAMPSGRGPCGRRRRRGKRSPPRPSSYPPGAPFTCGCGPVMKEGRRSTPPVSAITGCGCGWGCG